MTCLPPEDKAERTTVQRFPLERVLVEQRFGGGYPPGNSYEYQKKRLKEFAFRNFLILKGMLFDEPRRLMA